MEVAEMDGRGNRVFVVALWGWTAISLVVFAMRMVILWR